MDRASLLYALRAATPEDMAAIKRMVRAARLNPMGIDWPRFTVAVAASGKVLGCVQVKPHRDGSQELASLVVRPPWRGQGIGAALVRHAQQSAGPPLWLMCRAALMPFYRQFGFVQVQDAGRMAPYYRRVFRLVRLLQPLVSAVDRLSIMRWQPTGL